MIRRSLFLLLTGCTASIVKEYEATRLSALAEPVLSTSWEPDVVVRIGSKEMEEIVKPFLTQALSKKKGWSIHWMGMTAEAQPSFAVESLKLGHSNRCTECVAVDALLDGTLSFHLGPLAESVPVRIGLDLDMAFEGEAIDDQSVLRGIPKKLRTINVEVGQNRYGGMLKDATTEWLQQTVFANLEPFPIAEFGSRDLPVHAFRVQASNGVVSLQLLTKSPTPGRVAVSSAPLQDGFDVAISEKSLTGLARAEAFRRGAVGYDVVVEPTMIDFEDDQFDLGLRLWRPVGLGWWRDYKVHGSTKLVGGGMELTPKEVVEGQKSPGAGFADPLAALAEHRILETIEQALRTTLPLKPSHTLGPVSVDAKLKRIHGQGDTFRLSGDLKIHSK